jgi:UDP-N-acetylmuramoyl-L-alanyl-D-glutamate--2,6-diaminopimelate ligase
VKKLLSDILYKIAIIELKGSTSKDIYSIWSNSRAVQSDSVFVAIKGTQVDGHQYIDSAIEKGAVAVVCEILPEKLKKGITYIVCSNAAEAYGIMLANFYDNPSKKLKIVGVTGTNGKSSTVTMLYNLFTQMGYVCGLISTIEYKIGPYTGGEYVFMEVSSHAVEQHRIAGIEFTGAVFTNISHDHLDYHKTFEAYINAKKKFFDGLPKHAFALVNTDDKRGEIMVQNTKAHKRTFGLKSPADYKAKILENTLKGLLMNIDNEEVWFGLTGAFNAYNLLGVYATAMLLDQEKQSVLTYLSNIKSAEGRFETMQSPSGTLVIVDYAHTPDALDNVLSTITQSKREDQKVITVVGCGGNRDKTKRPVMAEVSAKYSDKLILTSDNPRDEDPMEIIEDMKQGISITQKKKVIEIVDRKQAIRTALVFAQEHDIVLVAGKGHEKYQEIAGEKHPFDDKEVIIEAFKNIQ